MTRKTIQLALHVLFIDALSNNNWTNNIQLIENKETTEETTEGTCIGKKDYLEQTKLLTISIKQLLNE